MNALLASEPAFLVVKFAGAAYLVYLGLHALWTAWRGGEVVIEAGAVTGTVLVALGVRLATEQR